MRSNGPIQNSPARSRRPAWSLIAALAVCWVLLACPPALAQEAGYCLACHRLGSEFTLGSLAWPASPQQAELLLCPALRQGGREMYQTERLLSRLHARLQRLKNRGVDLRSIQERLHYHSGVYRSCLELPVASLREVRALTGGARARLRDRVAAAMDRAEQAADYQARFAWGALLGLAALLCLMLLWRQWKGPGSGPGVGLVLLALALAGPAALAAQGPPAAPQALPPTLSQALRLEASLEQRVELTLALVELSRLAGTMSPQVAAQALGEALGQASGLSHPMVSEAASRLRAQVPEWPPPQQEAGLRLAWSLEQTSRTVWLLKVVGEAALSTSPQVAERALEAGLEVNRRNPHAASRDRDLGELIVVMARLDPRGARSLLARVGDPQARIATRLNLARLSNQPAEFLAAAGLARDLDNPRARALNLARVGRALYRLDPAQARRLFQEAFDQAGQVDPELDRALLQGEVARQLARVDPQAGWQMALRVGPLAGARFAAFRQAGVSLLGWNQTLARRALLAALPEARAMAEPYDRMRALCLAARDLAGLEPELVRGLLAELGPGASFHAAEAQGTLLLGRRFGSLAEALDALNNTVKDNLARLLTLERMAAIQSKINPPQGLAWNRRAAVLATSTGGHLGPEMLAQALAPLEPGVAVDLARGISQRMPKVKVLTALAREFVRRDRKAWARRALRSARRSTWGLKAGQRALRVRLLATLGRGWAEIDISHARRLMRRALAAVEEKD